MELTPLVNRYVNTIHMKNLPDFHKVPEGYVFDEDMSVKWNREKVIEHNASYDEELKRIRKTIAEERNFAVEDIYAYIRQEIPGLCEEAAKAIFEKAKDYSDNYEYDLEDNIEEYIEFAKIIRK